DLVARHRPAVTGGPGRLAPPTESERVTVAHPHADEAGVVVGLRPVEEQGDLAPHLGVATAPGGGGVDLFRVEPGVLGGDDLVVPEPPRAARRVPGVKDRPDDAGRV